MSEGMVIRKAPLSMQVCVPAAWTDDQVKNFADSECLCGTTGGWMIRKDGKDPERVKCGDVHHGGNVHIVLDA